MGLQFSCPLAASNDIECVVEPVIVKSVSFGDATARTPVRSVSFMDRDSKPKIMQSMGSGKMIEGCVSFRAGDAEIINSLTASSEKNLLIRSTTSKSNVIDKESPKPDRMMEKIFQFPLLNSSSPKHEAATKLQKVYKSFRTRRKLADCAVLIEQSWWKLLDFAELKHSSVSFFDLEKHETATSRWSRARTRAAKVGRGLSKNAKAQKLALQHWLEAIDPRHRYGHNLHFYYVNWLHSQSSEPFFYWLDIGEGKEVNLLEKCCRSKLHQQCIMYLGPMERKVYEVVVEDGKLLYKQTGELLNSSNATKGAKWIFVLSTSRTLYVGRKKKGKFQHSSFLAGGATLAAGRLVVEDGLLKAVWPHSGHYKPTPENFQDFISFLKENNVDITDVKMDSLDEEEESVSKKFISHLRSNSSEEDINEKSCLERQEVDAEDYILERTNSPAVKLAKSSLSNRFSTKLPNIKIPKTDDLLVKLETENQTIQSNPNKKQTVFAEDDEKTTEETVSKTFILERINSHKGMKTYQLGKQLSCKWSTGAGPRIGCLRDYPAGLQSHTLEQANLSPRSSPSRFRSSSSLSRVFAATSFKGEVQVPNDSQEH